MGTQGLRETAESSHRMDLHDLRHVSPDQSTPCFTPDGYSRAG